MSFRSVLVIAGAVLCLAAPSLSAQTAKPAPKPRDFNGAVECAAVLKASRDFDYEAKKATAIARTLMPADRAKDDEEWVERLIAEEVQIITGEKPGGQMEWGEFEDTLQECARWVNAQPAPPAAKPAAPKG